MIDSYFEYIDIVFSKIMSEYEDRFKNEILFIAKVISKFSRDGHTCLSIDDMVNNLRLDPEFEGDIPDVNNLKKAIKNSKLIGMDLNERTPFILYNNRLYIRKYFEYEREIEKIIENIRKVKREYKISLNIINKFKDIFKEKSEQAIAVLLSLFKDFVVITGGPGTGKTTTIKRIIEFYKLVEPAHEIVVSAPTGKAANRLKEGLGDIINEAFTLHRLLGIYENSVKYNCNNPLPYDLVIVDEASMVALPLMYKLLKALKKNAKIILVGDKNQLSSVEIGSVFRDLCNLEYLDRFSEDFSKFANTFGVEIDISKKDSVLDFGIELRKSFRFNEDIAILSNKIKEGDISGIDHIIKENRLKSINFRPIKKGLLLDILKKYVRDYFKRLYIYNDYRIISEYIFLCPVKKGIFGVENVNKIIEEFIIDEFSPELFRNNNNIYFHGKTLIISENDYNLGVFNGDIGIVLLKDNNFLVYFPDKNRYFDPVLLPSHSSAFAITIHKSQGSEYNAVGIIIPDMFSSIMTRELLYTAITRAKKKVDIFYNKSVFFRTIENITLRNSQLIINN